MQKQISATLSEASLNELKSRLKQTRWPRLSAVMTGGMASLNPG